MRSDDFQQCTAERDEEAEAEATRPIGLEHERGAQAHAAQERAVRARDELTV